MPKGKYFRGEVEIFLSDDEIAKVGTLYWAKDSQGARFFWEPLDVPLKTRNGVKMSARLQVVLARELAGENRVERDEHGLLIKISNDAYLKKAVNNTCNPIYSSLYNGHKINLFRNGADSKR